MLMRIKVEVTFRDDFQLHVDSAALVLSPQLEGGQRPRTVEHEARSPIEEPESIDQFVAVVEGSSVDFAVSDVDDALETRGLNERHAHRHRLIIRHLQLTQQPTLTGNIREKIYACFDIAYRIGFMSICTRFCAARAHNFINGEKLSSPCFHLLDTNTSYVGIILYPIHTSHSLFIHLFIPCVLLTDRYMRLASYHTFIRMCVCITF